MEPGRPNASGRVTNNLDDDGVRVDAGASGDRVDPGADGARVDDAASLDVRPLDSDTDTLRQRLSVDGQTVTFWASDPDRRVVVWDQRRYRLQRRPPLSVEATAADRGARGGAGRLTAPMPGKVVRIAVVEGQRVGQNQLLVVLEAMKMEHVIEAPHGGVVTEVCVKSASKSAGAPTADPRPGGRGIRSQPRLKFEGASGPEAAPGHLYSGSNQTSRQVTEMQDVSGLEVTRETAEANKAVVRRWFEETDRGNMAIVDELLRSIIGITTRPCLTCRPGAKAFDSQR